MRMRIAAVMAALVLLVFPLGTALLVQRSFQLSMEHEKARALSEEAAIARAVALEIGGGGYEKTLSVAQQLQARYGSKTLETMLVYHGTPMAGAALPQADAISQLLAVTGRATLLDGASKTLYIAHRLSDSLVLLVGSDVSAVYALRRQLSIWAAALTGAMLLLSAGLTLIFSNWLAQPIRKLAQQRQELIDALAHEMRTPLTAILGGARLLEGAKLPPEKRAVVLSTIAGEAQRLSDMDERLLLLTRMDHEAVNMQRFSAREMALEAVGVFERVEVCGVDATYLAERELTIQLLRNLVTNALRAGGASCVRVTLHEDGFDVADDGCGMTGEQIACAFEPFYKADKARTRAYGGAGLGLSICRKIAELHGGTIRIESQPGRGTNVVYRFVTTR